jgi:hypothetical protein
MTPNVSPFFAPLSFALTIALCCVALVRPVSASELVPFVGCPGDGQNGPVDPPEGDTAPADVSKSEARQLAHYEGPTHTYILAPRDWNCVFLEGSGGQILIVAPTDELDRRTVPRLKGPAVIHNFVEGGFSGRFDIAEYGAQVFSKEIGDFVQGVINEGLEPKENFHFGPYPGDKLKYRDARTVEFETPAGRRGIGASGRLIASELPIFGLAALSSTFDPDINMVVVQVRLPPQLRSLAPSIIRSVDLSGWRP